MKKILTTLIINMAVLALYQHVYAANINCKVGGVTRTCDAATSCTSSSGACACPATKYVCKSAAGSGSQYGCYANTSNECKNTG